MPRAKLDYYKTPGFATESLLDNLKLDKGLTIFDCCSGNGEISNIIKEKGYKVITNDIDNNKPADYHFDAASYWNYECDFVITNPPFNQAIEIARYAHNRSRIGVALLLRLSFLEPVYERQNFLSSQPPYKMIVLPRISFSMNGKTDSVTVAWMIWLHKYNLEEPRIIIVRK